MNGFLAERRTSENDIVSFVGRRNALVRADGPFLVNPTREVRHATAIR